MKVKDALLNAKQRQIEQRNARVQVVFMKVWERKHQLNGGDDLKRMDRVTGKEQNKTKTID